MNWNNTRHSASEKNRIREEIDAQVREFIQRGGKIDQLSASGLRQRPNAIGSVWHIDDIVDLER